MADDDAFLRLILDAPDDDGPRLLYADWLAEHGEPDRAEFIRLQCAHERGAAGLAPALHMDELLRLPGVARKTANVVAAELGDPQGIVVDTHVRRLSQRLGFTREEDPVKIERDLIRLVLREDWGRFPHLLIWHGRRVCIARRPLCEACVVNDLCPSSRV